MKWATTTPCRLEYWVTVVILVNAPVKIFQIFLNRFEEVLVGCHCLDFWIAVYTLFIVNVIVHYSKRNTDTVTFHPNEGLNSIQNVGPFVVVMIPFTIFIDLVIFL